jgi:hypothetical protein
MPCLSKNESKPCFAREKARLLEDNSGGGKEESLRRELKGGKCRRKCVGNMRRDWYQRESARCRVKWGMCTEWSVRKRV